MTDLKDVKIQLIATQLRLKRANDLLLKYREADFREPVLSAKVDDHFAKCRDSVRNFEQAKMDVIMEIADAIWDLKPGEVEQWVALKAAEGGVLEEVDRISEQSLVETITAGGLFADVCIAERHRRCVSDGSYTPPSELQLEKLHKAFAQVKENPDSVVTQDVVDSRQTIEQLERDLSNSSYELNQVLSREMDLVAELNACKEAAAEDRSDLLQANTLLGAWVQVFKGGNHGILAELLVEKTEKYLP